MGTVFCNLFADLGRPLPAIYSLRLADEFADAQVQGFDHDSEAGGRLPRFSPNAFLSFLLPRISFMNYRRQPSE